MKAHKIVIQLILSMLFFTSSLAAQVPTITMSASFQDEPQSQLTMSVTLSSANTACKVYIYAVPKGQKWRLREQLRARRGRARKALTYFTADATTFNLSAQNLGRLNQKTRRVWVRVFMGAKVLCGRKRKSVNMGYLQLAREQGGTLGYKPGNWIKDLKAKIVMDGSTGTPTPTPSTTATPAPSGTATPAPSASPSDKYSLWQQSSYFRGANMVAWGDADQTDNYELLTKQDVLNLAATGANVVHLSVAGIWKIKSPYDLRQQKQDELDNLVQWAKDAGLYYIIAVRSGPGRRDVSEEDDDPSKGCSDIWTNSVTQGKYGDMLAAMIQRYNSSKMVALNLTVEPTPFTCPTEQADDPESLKTLMDNAGISLKAIYEAWIAKVRAVDATLPVIVQAAGWSSPNYFKIMEEVSDPYVIYDTHMYQPYSFTHESPCNWPGTYADPDNDWEDATWNKTLLQKYFGYVRTFQQKVNKPVILGEFGGNCKTPPALKNYFTDMLDITLGYGWHLTIWGWNNNKMHGLNKASQDVQDFMGSVFQKTYNGGS